MNVINITDQLLPIKPLVPLNPDHIINIIIHHAEATHCTWQDINSWHKDQDWSCGGYNEYIAKDGTAYIMRGDNIGAQCKDHNSTSYGICCEGDYNNELLMPDIQKQALIKRIKFNRERFKNYKSTVPHWYFTDTICPGKYFPVTEILQRIEVIKLTVDEALAIQVAAGVINSPEYWKKVVDTTKNFDQYVINVSKRLQELQVTK